jgi:predicted transcriptional regulator
MKRTTISLPDDLAKMAAREAERRRISVSELAREALADHLGVNGERREIPFANLGSSGRGDIASRHEEYLAQTWADDIARDR